MRRKEEVFKTNVRLIVSYKSLRLRLVLELAISRTLGFYIPRIVDSLSRVHAVRQRVE